MGTQNILWNMTKYVFTGSLIGVTISDRYASVVSLKGGSMSPTFNPHGDGLLTRNISSYIHIFCPLHSNVGQILTGFHLTQVTVFYWRNYASKSTSFLKVM